MRVAYVFIICSSSSRKHFTSESSTCMYPQLWAKVPIAVVKVVNGANVYIYSISKFKKWEFIDSLWYNSMPGNAAVAASAVYHDGVLTARCLLGVRGQRCSRRGARHLFFQVPECSYKVAPPLPPFQNHSWLWEQSGGDASALSLQPWMSLKRKRRGCFTAPAGNSSANALHFFQPSPQTFKTRC